MTMGTGHIDLNSSYKLLHGWFDKDDKEVSQRFAWNDRVGHALKHNVIWPHINPFWIRGNVSIIWILYPIEMETISINWILYPILSVPYVLSVGLSVILSDRRSVDPLVPLVLFWRLRCSSWKICITAPAQQHATGFAVYPALFRYLTPFKWKPFSFFGNCIQFK